MDGEAPQAKPMKHPELGWPSGRVNQIALVVSALGAVWHICLFIAHGFFADNIEASQYVNFDSSITFDFILSVLGLGLLAGLAVGKRYWLLSVAALLLLGSLVLAWLAASLSAEWQAAIEVAVTLLRAIGYLVASIGLLRQERLGDISLEFGRRD